MPFTFFPCDTLKGPVLVEPRHYRDERGFFMETYKAGEFAAAGIPDEFIQDNHSLSAGPVIRGLHFQLPPRQQAKLIRVTEGRIWDVIVDLRGESPGFLRWLAVELDAESGRMLYIPAGFAHGFAALSPRAQLCYKCSAEYDSGLDSGIRWNDPALGIPWPLENPVISPKDGRLPPVNSDYLGRIAW